MKPAIFNTEMVRAILDGRKTQTRRIASDTAELVYRCAKSTPSAPYQISDIIYVRETWSDYPQYYIWYKADFPLHWDAKDTEHGEEVHIEADNVKWKSSIHMPKEYARLFLRVKDVHIERLNEISEEDAEKEGVECWSGESALINFMSLWESIYGKDSFDNRYVWVIEFERISKEEAMSETAT